MSLPDVAIPLLRSWDEIQADVGLNWFIYLSMPFVAALVGWATKLVAIEMLYRPVEFRGVGPFGWQGIVPRRAGKVASTTIELLTENLLDPREILDDIDPAEAVRELEEPLRVAVQELGREITETIRPGLWDSLPEAGRRTIVNRAQAAAPQVLDNLLRQVRGDLTRYLDLQYLTVTTLVRNKQQLNDLMRTMADTPMAFVRRSGIYFGLIIGTVQMVAWAYFHNPWIMPAFGFFIGFASDWLALNMLFRPTYSRKVFGKTVHGVLHRDREEITQGYARIMATDLFAPDVLFDALLNGPTADQLFAAIEKEMSAAIDAQAGMAGTAVRLAVGSTRYDAAKKQLVDAMLERVPETMEDAKAYAARAIDVETLIADKMRQLTPEEFEAIMRPVFKDDEPVMITVGAILGFAVGELQVLMVHLFERSPS